jgi:hypothetical protein
MRLKTSGKSSGTVRDGQRSRSYWSSKRFVVIQTWSAQPTTDEACASSVMKLRIAWGVVSATLLLVSALAWRAASVDPGLGSRSSSLEVVQKTGARTRKSEGPTAAGSIALARPDALRSFDSVTIATRS